MNTFLIIAEIIVSIVLIISVIMQTGRDAGFSGTISGVSQQISDTRNRGADGFLKSVTKISAVLFIFLALALAIVS